MVDINRKRWVEGRVQALHSWTDTLYSIRIEVDIEPFTAGQFTKIALPVNDELVGRPYSFVNAPAEPLLEFYFITVPNGPLTSHLVKLQPGDTIEVSRRASGFLTIDEVPDAHDLWLLSTGTAIGPFLSILKSQPVWERFKRVVLVHAVRRVEELSFSETIQTIRQVHADQFQFIPFVSRETTDFALQARIPIALNDGRLEERAGLQIATDSSQVMLCGNPDMVKDTSTALQARGLTLNRRRTPGHISVENYW
ncbi:Ferredoxin--NADP(+) reductase [hydrothermal vent metagenome]|uniref:ferredoxin--NADP(+) reductase n=1 Tax=hydrothermal vent metagenome TaxID=652676 RepID=A0A3B0ZHA9_9ZZZZ